MEKNIKFGQQSTKVKQLSDLIEQDILVGKYRTDTSLPSINALSKTYHVSRDIQTTKRFVILSQNDLCDFHVY